MSYLQKDMKQLITEVDGCRKRIQKEYKTKNVKVRKVIR